MIGLPNASCPSVHAAVGPAVLAAAAEVARRSALGLRGTIQDAEREQLLPIGSALDAIALHECAASSGSPGQGVVQITHAMTPLDSTTRHSAGAARQLSPAAVRLEAQAARLQALMAGFWLGGLPLAPASASTPARRAAAPRAGAAPLRYAAA